MALSINKKKSLKFYDNIILHDHRLNQNLDQIKRFRLI